MNLYTLASPDSAVAPAAPELRDRFGRRIDYVRVSVTDRCDLRCSYCIPKGFKDFEEPAHWLTFDEMERLLGVFVRLGVRRVRLTGGEPLLRRGLPDLARRLSALGVDDLSLSTNGTQLRHQAHALRQAGVQRLNVSLDSLRRECVEQLSGRDSLQQVLDGLQAAQVAGFDRIKINMVVMATTPDADIDAMVDFCRQHAFVLRLIEAMPMGDSGRSAGTVDLQQVARRLRQRFDLHETAQPLGAGPARYLSSADGDFSVGFITPMSQHFCATCNRVRLAVDGTLYLCLGQEEKLELGPLLRGGASDSELETAIRQ
ncbi:MAG TPA: GTP 3',8-cyclase MoaA, partial [Candidatus Kapabacteria bacterium]|nr:GTP 3',8-cyclase MoaA [Candidatus Kapabacteria bacterium]